MKHNESDLIHMRRAHDLFVRTFSAYKTRHVPDIINSNVVCQWHHFFDDKLADRVFKSRGA